MNADVIHDAERLASIGRSLGMLRESGAICELIEALEARCSPSILMERTRVRPPVNETPLSDAEVIFGHKTGIL